MINDLTKSIETASISARVLAFLEVAGFVSGAVRIDDAFWIDAGGCTVDYPALAV